MRSPTGLRPNLLWDITALPSSLMAGLRGGKKKGRDRREGKGKKMGVEGGKGGGNFNPSLRNPGNANAMLLKLNG